MQHDVFISYTQDDRKLAIYIHDMFQARRLDSWIAPSTSNGVQVGQGFEKEVVDAIEASKAFVLVYSDYCNKSYNIIREIRQWELRQQDGHPIIILRVDRSPYGKDLSYYLTGLQYIDLPKDNGKEALNQLLSAVVRQVQGYVTGAKESTDQMLLSAGMKLLRQKKYPEAASTLQQHLEIAPDDPQSRFYWGLAIMGGRKSRQLDGLVVKKLVQSLQPFWQDRHAAFINVLLAIIKHGYYTANGFKVPAPSVQELLQEVSLDREKAADLLTHLDEPENEVWRLVASTFAKH